MPYITLGVYVQEGYSPINLPNDENYVYDTETGFWRNVPIRCPTSPITVITESSTFEE